MIWFVWFFLKKKFFFLQISCIIEKFQSIIIYQFDFKTLIWVILNLIISLISTTINLYYNSHELEIFQKMKICSQNVLIMQNTKTSISEKKSPTKKLKNWNQWFCDIKNFVLKKIWPFADSNSIVFYIDIFFDYFLIQIQSYFLYFFFSRFLIIALNQRVISYILLTNVQQKTYDKLLRIFNKNYNIGKKSDFAQKVSSQLWTLELNKVTVLTFVSFSHLSFCTIISENFKLLYY